MPGYTVERSDLRDWATQVGRASEDLDLAHKYATSNIPDGEFGKILELITGPYADMLTSFHSVLEADATRLDKTSGALSAAEKTYQGTDDQASDDFAEFDEGKSGTVQDDGGAAAFKDTSDAATELIAPGGEGAELPDTPEVSFGFLFDMVCDLCVWVGGPDPREEVTQWIAGDVGKAAVQVTAWQCLANAMDTVAANLKAGQAAIANTWKGEAADAAATHIGKWLSCLPDQGSGMRQMGNHLSDAIDEAVKMAQFVVDAIKTLISIVSAGLTNAAIPFYGQWKLIDSVWEGIKMVWSAIKVIKVFWNFLKMIIDAIHVVVASFSKESLPPAPAGVPA